MTQLSLKKPPTGSHAPEPRPKVALSQQQKRAQRGRFVTSVLVLGMSFLAAMPLYYIVVSSFKNTVEMSTSPLALPSSLNLTNFSDAFALNDMGRAFLNSILITVGAIIIQIIVGSMASFGMVIGSGRFVAGVGALLAIAFAIPVQATLVPQYRMFASVGLTDSLLGITLLYTGGAVFCYFLIVGYMRGLPTELLEAPRMDGAGAFRIYWSIILPLCRPILITVIVFQTMSIWNDFLTPNVFLSSPEKRTVILQVYAAVGAFTTNWPLFMATTMIALVPVFLFFVFAQKWIVGGMMAGSVKG